MSEQPPAGQPAPQAPVSTLQWISRLSQPAIAAIVAGAIVLFGLAGITVASILGADGDRAEALPSPEPTVPGALVPTPLGTPTPEPTTSPTDGGGGGDSTLDIIEEVDVAGAVTVPIPENWSYKQVDDATLTMSDDVGTFIYLKVAERSASADPVAVVGEAYDSIVVDAEGYSQLEAQDAVTLELSGSLTGSARIDYTGLWNDTQSTYGVGGAVWAQIRQDGKALFVLLEASPAGNLEGNAYSWTPAIQGIFSSFAGS